MEAFVAIRNRDPHLDECNSVGTVLDEQCGLDFRPHSFPWLGILVQYANCSAVHGSPLMKGNRRDISSKRLRKIIPVRYRPNSDTSQWRANCRTKYLIV